MDTQLFEKIVKCITLHKTLNLVVPVGAVKLVFVFWSI